MHRVSAGIRNGWFLLTQKGPLNLDQAALEHYQICLARIKPLIDGGKVLEAKERFYAEITNNQGTRKLAPFAVQQFKNLKNTEALSNFLNLLPYDPRAIDEAGIIRELQKTKD